jgi:hypothetical protein
MSQYSTNFCSPKRWNGSNGEAPLGPKGDGRGVMLSAFQSREFGFGIRPEQRRA